MEDSNKTHHKLVQEEKGGWLKKLSRWVGKVFFDRKILVETLVLWLPSSILYAIWVKRLVADYVKNTNGVGLVLELVGAALGLIFVPAIICAALFMVRKIPARGEEAKMHYWGFLIFEKWFSGVVACLFFGALFASTIEFVEKLYFGSAFLFFAVVCHCREIIQTVQVEDRNTLSWLQFQIIERRISGEVVDIKAELERYQKRNLFLGSFVDDGSNVVLRLVLTYLTWIGIGGLISTPLHLVIAQIR